MMNIKASVAKWRLLLLVTCGRRCTIVRTGHTELAAAGSCTTIAKWICAATAARYYSAISSLKVIWLRFVAFGIIGFFFNATRKNTGRNAAADFLKDYQNIIKNLSFLSLFF